VVSGALFRKQVRWTITYKVQLLLAFSESVEERHEQLAKLVLYVSRDDGVVFGLRSFRKGWKVMCARLSITGRRGCVGRRKINGAEVFGESDGERSDECESFLVRGELRAQSASAYVSR
jgi:hypothetical protein